MSESQAKVVECVPPDCALCGRSLLVGEALHLFRDGTEKLCKVCDLCRDRARSRGYERIEFNAANLRVQPGGAVKELVDRDAVIAGLGGELEYVRQQLGAAEAALLEHDVHGDTLSGITERLRRQERELQRLRRENNPALIAEQQRTLARQRGELADIKAQLRARNEEVERLRHARVAECSTITMQRCALDAFNSSEGFERMARIARTLDDPIVTVEDLGAAIPRLLRLTLVWDIAWYEFRIKVDLGNSVASVHEDASGGDPKAVADAQKQRNAQWRASGIVLR